MDGIEPDCLASGCIVQFDRLEPEDFRLLEIRYLLVHLGDLGLGEKVAREYALDRDDLYQLAVVEAQCRAMAQTQQRGDDHGEGC